MGCGRIEGIEMIIGKEIAYGSYKEGDGLGDSGEPVA